MKGIFLEHARFLPAGHVVPQVKRLNEKLLDYVLPRVMTEIDAYSKYRADVSSMSVPMDRPVNMSSKGTRQLEMMRR
jgi:hypothetical protein